MYKWLNLLDSDVIAEHCSHSIGSLVMNEQICKLLQSSDAVAQTVGFCILVCLKYFPFD